MNKGTRIMAILIFVLIVVAVLVYAFYSPGKIEVLKKPNPIARISTNYGNFSIELYENKVSQLTDHFIRYSMLDFYDGLIFHQLRVSTKELPNGTLVPYDGAMVMTGAYYTNFTKRNPSIILEYNKRTDVVAGLTHTDLAVSWIHDSYGKIGARWYVCNGDFSGRAFQMDSQDPVFGKVINGEEVIREIGSLPVYNVNTSDPQLSRVPMGPNNTTVLIKHIDIYRPNSEHSDIILKADMVEKEGVFYIHPFFLKYPSITRATISMPNSVAG